MVRNRLAEMQANSKHVTQSDIEAAREAEAGGASNIEMQPLNKLDKDLSASTVDFFSTFEEIVVTNIEKVKRNVEEIKVLQKRILMSVKAEEKDSAENRMNDLIEENKRLSRIIQTRLKSERAKVEDKLVEKPTSPIKKWTTRKKPEENTAKRKTEMRMRQTQIDTQSKRFYEIWNDYNSNQANYRDKSKELLVRRCRIANSSYSDDQIEDMLEEGKTDVFNDCILSQMKSAKQQLTELQDRHDEFIKLEKSIIEVRDMFLEIANLVTQQGELVDNIMQNVERAGMDVERGADHLNKASELKSKARKMKVILASVGIVILLIIILVIMGELGAFSSSGKSNEVPKIETKYVTEIVYIDRPTTTTIVSTTTTTATTISTSTKSNLIVDEEFQEKTIPP